eukprot:2865420-Rhodomonas_salina.2
MFGCRLCDWDACEECVSETVKEQELQLEAAANKPQKGKGKVSTEGSWKMLRGADKYKNEYMYLRHEGSGVCVELPCVFTPLLLHSRSSLRHSDKPTSSQTLQSRPVRIPAWGRGTQHVLQASAAIRLGVR